MNPGPAYQLFRHGYDSLDIAHALGVKEHVALRMISYERSVFKNSQKSNETPEKRATD